ncbi:MAG: hypothetical protein Q8O67_19020 [Deltaproteobacteria bacterium]|nr:hypothetical protein [Deltaproteobacteria bacterium]
MDFLQALADEEPAEADGFLAYMVFALGVPVSSLSAELQGRVVGVFVEAGVSEDVDVAATLDAWFAAHPPSARLLDGFRAALTAQARADGQGEARAAIGVDVARTPVGHGEAPIGTVKGSMARFAKPKGPR